jgi:hypothetical protein
MSLSKTLYFFDLNFILVIRGKSEKEFGLIILLSLKS